jgi:hypothetical protein
LIAYGTLTLDAETTAISRLVIGESDRFPDIAATFYESAIARTSPRRDGCGANGERGLIKLDDAHAASGMLRGMMIMELQRAAMLRKRALPNAREIAHRARMASQIFLNECRT